MRRLQDVVPVARVGAFVREAMRLAADGELGNSDAIRLLQLPHETAEIKHVLATLDGRLTPQARSKLTLAAFVPLPPHVDNQRYEPIFDRYPISGKTYTTASGATVLSEVQYYNGKMVQVIGDCANLGGVRDALAGSGYTPMLLRHADGRELAIAQFWAHTLTDTSLRPYNAMFLVVATVREDAPASQRVLRADRNGLSSVLSMLYGAFNRSSSTYENFARLFFARLLDSTEVAIDVGRERMGTDKRPGTIELVESERQRTFSVRDGAGRGVAKIAFSADDGASCLSQVAQAAATAGIPLADCPVGTEYVYPSVARIGRGPVVQWQWRTDVRSPLRSIAGSTIAFDSSSEEGRLLSDWGFQPRVMAYIPNVRGVVTGISDAAPAPGPVHPERSKERVTLTPR